jgi:hypothetical protein
MGTLILRLMLRVLRGANRFVRADVLPPIMYLMSLPRSPRQILSALPETVPDAALGPRVALFCHFDVGGEVRPFVLHQLRALRDAGFTIGFVSNSGHLREGARAELAPLCACIIVRRNVGYDFGAWRDALERLALPRADTEALLLVNDSVYGPFRPLAPVLQRFDFARADVWGMTESWQSRYHLQSYFLAVSGRVLRHPAWATFWREVRPVASKDWVIQHYEVGLTQSLIRAGFACRAVWPYQELLGRIDPALTREEDEEEARAREPLDQARRKQARRIGEAASRRLALNPTSDLWRQLLEAGCPFIKRELLRRNPTRVADLADWRDVVGVVPDSDPAGVEIDLRRAMRNRAA